jgi:hypothetical protein
MLVYSFTQCATLFKNLGFERSRSEMLISLIQKKKSAFVCVYLRPAKVKNEVAH